MSAADGVLLGFFFATGAVVGSFANVCIHRLPRGVSVVHPGSHCPACGKPIAFYDNVPVVSWLLLGGRCRRCRAPIRIRYPAVELLVALLFLAAGLLYGPTLVAASAALLSAACVILAATDLEARTLPDEVTFSTLGCGLLLAALRDRAARGPDRSLEFRFAESHLLEALLGALLGAVFLEGVRRAYTKLRGQEGMGRGDVKMLAMAGAFTGPAGVFLTLFFASLAGTAVAGGAALARGLRWSLEVRRARRSSSEARAVAARAGLLVGEDGRLLSASARFREIPGAAPEGTRFRADFPTAGRLLAFVRLARARGRRGARTASGRLALDDGADFFRVLAARAEPTPAGLLVLLARADVPFGVFLACGALAAFAAGRSLWEALAAGVPWIPRLLP
ncbi:MAG TPA: prepilin peptidase [Thermoanaerobaculia bacterium]|nr:prepilin peptidase [Thermoanaerobaculia bacterium]